MCALTGSMQTPDTTRGGGDKNKNVDLLCVHVHVNGRLKPESACIAGCRTGASRSDLHGAMKSLEIGINLPNIKEQKSRKRLTSGFI